MDPHVENIRQNVRQLTFKERKEQRDTVLNIQRGTSMYKDNPDLTPEVTTDLAIKIRNKGSFTLKDYSLINQALLQSEDNIAAFFKVDGALQGVVRDLTSQNAAFQLQAANCCCNLSLGNPKHCTMVTKSAAPYLVSYLDGLNIPLMDVSAWSLGNLAGGGAKPWHILTSQGLVPKLLNHVNTSSTLLQPAVYALAHYIHTGIAEEIICEEPLLRVTQHADALLKAEEHGYWVLYLLSCRPACSEQLLQIPLIDHLLQVLPIQEHMPSVVGIVRILGNLCSDQKGASQFVESTFVLKAIQFILSASQYHVYKEGLWLLGNVINNIPVALQPHLQVLCNKVESELSTVIIKVNAEV